MGTMLRATKQDLGRALCSKGTLGAIAVTLIIQMQAVTEELLMPGGDVLYYFKLSLDTGYMQVLMPCVGTLCYAWVLLDDGQSGVWALERIRVDERRYLLAKACACFASAFIAVALGMALFCGVLALRVPLISEIGRTNMDAYEYSLLGDLLAQGRYFGYIASMILVRGLAAGAWALVGMATSVVFRERYALHIAPFMIAYFMEIVMGRAGATITPLGVDVGRVTGFAALTHVGLGALAAVFMFGGIACIALAVLLGPGRRRLRHDPM